MKVASKNISILMLFASLVLTAKGNDTLTVNSYNSVRISNYLNYWSGSENITGMIFNRLDNYIDFDYQLNKGSGDLHRIMEGGDTRSHEFTTKSYRKVKKINLFGEFSYNNNLEKGSRWNGTFDPYRGNPYILGDSVRNSTYKKEGYHLVGGMATTLNKNLSYGIKLDYFVGVGAKQKDPRPQNTVMQMEITPGLIWHREKYNLGFNLGLLQRKEEIDYIQMITEDPDISYFYFKGFGFYMKDIKMDNFRYQQLNQVSGNIQFETKNRKHPSFTELTFKYGKEEIQDGSSVIIKERGGDWVVMDARLKETIHIGKRDKLHKLVLEASYINGDGVEFNQQKVYKGNLADYVTLSSYLKMNRQILSGSLQYNYQSLLPSEQRNWLIQSGLGIVSKAETFYYIPEIFTADYTNGLANVYFEKNFYFNKLQLTPQITGSYLFNMTNNLNLSNLNEITKKEMKDVYLYDYNYYTSDKINLSAGLTCGFFTGKSKGISQFFLNLNYNQVQAISSSTGIGLFAAKIGFVF